jgi:hypothetical protein
MNQFWIKAKGKSNIKHENILIIKRTIVIIGKDKIERKARKFNFGFTFFHRTKFRESIKWIHN